MSTPSSSAATTATATGTGTTAALSGSGSSASTVAKPPPLNVRVHRFDIITKIIPRIRRGKPIKVRCLHLAPSRAEFQQKYPDHFFCSKCENLYQTWVIDGADDSCHVDSSRFMCEATHDNFISPSQLRPDVIAAMNRNVLDDDYDSNDDVSIESYYGSDDDNNTTTTTTTNNNNTTATRKQLKRNTVSLEKEASTTNREVKKMKNNCTEDEQGVARILKSYQELITELKSKLKHLEEVIKKKDIYIGELERSATK